MIRRLSVCLSTAFFATFLETTAAQRPSSLGSQVMEKCAETARFPAASGAKEARVRRFALGSMLLGLGDRKVGAALAAAADKDILARRRGGTSTEAVRRGALALLRLVGSLRHVFSSFPQDSNRFRTLEQERYGRQ